VDVRDLAGKTALVTGAGSGIGRAIATRLAAEGATVGVLDRDAAAAERVRAEIEAAHGRAFAVVVDITDYGTVASAVAGFESAAGGTEGLVNCAGWDRMATFAESTPELWRRVIDINLTGTLNVTHRVLPGMVARRRGRIVSIASDAGRVGSSGEAVYSACKGGLIAFTKSLAREHARHGITVNCVCPGPTETPLLDAMAHDGGLGEKVVPALERAIPMRRLGQPDDYPGAVAFFLSDDATFVTGQTLSVSGGLTMAG
jgi:2-hydroxycyclohexanecarboxyl-CoA dehydrogenase